MNKICVYTCITGNYDDITELTVMEKNIDYICFTNNKMLKSNTWKIKYIDEKVDNWNLARKVKILSSKYLPKYELTVWIDGSINVLKPISEFIKNECDLENYDMVGFNHQERNCIYQEINANAYLNKEKIQKLTRLEKFLRKEKYPENNGLIESSVLVRKNIKSVNDLMIFWYKTLCEYTNRDQLSFNYCFWKMPIKLQTIDMYVQNNMYFKNNWHKKNLNKKKNMFIYFGNLKDGISNLDLYGINNMEYTTDELKSGIKIKIQKDCNEISIVLKDEIFKKITKIDSNPKCKVDISSINIKKEIFFDGLPTILLKSNFNKNKFLNIRLSLDNNSESDLIYKLNNSLFDEINKLNKCVIENNTLNENLKKISDELSSEKKNVEKLKNDNELLRSELSNIYSSKSWRITKPLRKITKCLRRR